MGSLRTFPALVRLPEWSALEERRCPLTGSDGTVVGRRGDGLEVRFSAEPALYFVSPAPTPAALGAFYSSYFRGHREASDLFEPSSVRETLDAVPEGDFRVLVLDALLGGLRGRRALDVGFGRGHNLVRLARAGADVCGVDLDPDAVERAKAALRLPQVALGTIEAAPPGAYDLITMYDLIEHPLDPLALLDQAVARLRPGGLLAVDTPNASFAALDETPHLFRVDLEHMQYFSASTCTWLSRRLGLEVVHLEQHGFPGSGSAVASDLSARVKDQLRRVRLVYELNRLRRRVARYQPMTRGGRYALFSVFRKPA